MPSFSKHTVGILGGMGPAATANFLRLLVKSFNEAGARTDSEFPKIVMLGLPLEDWGTTGAKDKLSVEKQIREGLIWLSRQDASVIAIPCNTVHEFVKYDPRIVSIIDATLDECSTESILGLLCSRQTRESNLYSRPGFDIRCFSDQDDIDSVIEDAMSGEFEDISDIIDLAHDCGIQTVILGCTELSLCSYEYSKYDVSVIDSSAALARAVVRRVSSL
jgi:aspartate racemase